MDPVEDRVFPRPPAESIKSAWTELFSDPLISVGRLRAAGLSKQGLGQASPDGGITLRSIYWRFYHSLLPPPTSLELFPPSLETSRAAYGSLRRRYLVSPDGRWADDCSPPLSHEPVAGPSRPSRPAQNRGSEAAGGGGWDPLSLDESSPWKEWYKHQEVRKMIWQDVERTFPDIEYFELERVRKCLVTCLFLFAITNPDVGYRQGMHELLAVCLMTIDRDTLDHEPPSAASPLSSPKGKGVEEAMYATLDRRYVEHDTFELFCAIMKSAKAFYEWRAEEGPRISGGSMIKAPVIIRCNHLQQSLIRRIDPQLWEKFENEGLEAQIWAIRWIRLIFTRELPLNLALKLWDGIFAEDPRLEILDFVCVAMVLLIRNELLDADHGMMLTNLLRYPAPSVSYPFNPFLILSQALLLRNSVNPATGVEVVIQNQEILGIKAQPPEQASDDRPPRSTPSMRGKQPARGYQGLAANLFERAQAAGLDKAIMSTVSDLRKNLPDSATAYSYLPNLPFSPVTSPHRDASSPFPSFPPSSAISRPHQQHVQSSLPIHPSASTDSITSAKTLRDAERELAELKLAMIGMGKAMTQYVDALPSNTDAQVRTGLKRVRDGLLDAPGKDVEELVKEWGWHEGLESRGPTPGPEDPDDIALPARSTKPATSVEEATPTPPPVERMPPPLQAPAPVVASTFKAAPSWRSEVNTGPSPLMLPKRDDRPMASLPRTPTTATPSNSRSAQYRPPASSDGLRFGEGDGSVLSEVAVNSERQSTAKEVHGDPLAGMGVRVVSPSGHRPGQGRGVDPLGGLGVR